MIIIDEMGTIFNTENAAVIGIDDAGQLSMTGNRGEQYALCASKPAEALSAIRKALVAKEGTLCLHDAESNTAGRENAKKTAAEFDGIPLTQRINRCFFCGESRDFAAEPTQDGHGGLWIKCRRCGLAGVIYRFSPDLNQ